MPDPQIDVRRSSDRFTTTTDWLTSRHSFSFGPHYDPDNVGFGPLVSHNEDVVLPGTGFDPHPHRDLEIVTWMLEGTLVHEDSDGNRGLAFPGLVQRVSTGSGIVHSERNDSWEPGGPAPREPAHLVQMWVLPDEPGLTPGYAQSDVGDALAAGGLTPIASGMRRHDAPVRVNNDHAGLHAARLDAGAAVTLPQAPRLHLFVARGSADLEAAGPLAQGDAARIAGGGQRVTGGPAGAEVLVWEMHTGR